MHQGTCRRKADRRQQHQPFHIHSVLGRRRQARRSYEMQISQAVIVDTYPKTYFIVTFAILSLCFADAFNTIQLISHGGKELNPVMDILLGLDLKLFVATKFALTGLGLILLVGYRNKTFVKWLKTQHLLYGVLMFYAALIIYQSALMPDYLLGLVLPI